MVQFLHKIKMIKIIQKMLIKEVKMICKKGIFLYVFVAFLNNISAALSQDVAAITALGFKPATKSDLEFEQVAISNASIPAGGGLSIVAVEKEGSSRGGTPQKWRDIFWLKNPGGLDDGTWTARIWTDGSGPRSQRSKNLDIAKDGHIWSVTGRGPDSEYTSIAKTVSFGVGDDVLFDQYLFDDVLDVALGGDAGWFVLGANSGLDSTSSGIYRDSNARGSTTTGGGEFYLSNFRVPNLPGQTKTAKRPLKISAAEDETVLVLNENGELFHWVGDNAKWGAKANGNDWKTTSSESVWRAVAGPQLSSGKKLVNIDIGKSESGKVIAVDEDGKLFVSFWASEASESDATWNRIEINVEDAAIGSDGMLLVIPKGGGKIYYKNVATVAFENDSVGSESLSEYEVKLTGLKPAIPGSPNPGREVFGFSWRNDGKFYSICTQAKPHFMIYSFDGKNSIKVAEYAHHTDWGNAVLTTKWHPGGEYVAATGYVGTGKKATRIFNFDGSNLTLIGSFSEIAARGIAWNPVKPYFAIGASDGTVKVYYLDENRKSIEQTDSTQINRGERIFDLDFSPNGEFLTVAGAAVSSNDNSNVEVYRFVAGTYVELQKIRSKSLGITHCRNSRWDSSGKYLACVGHSGSGDGLQIFEFNGSDLNLVARRPEHAGRFCWSKKGLYFATTGLYGHQVSLIKFDGRSISKVGGSVSKKLTVHALEISPNDDFVGVGTYEVPRVAIYPIKKKWAISDVVSILGRNGYISFSGGQLAVVSSRNGSEDDVKFNVEKTSAGKIKFVTNDGMILVVDRSGKTFVRATEKDGDLTEFEVESSDDENVQSIKISGIDGSENYLGLSSSGELVTRFRQGRGVGRFVKNDIAAQFKILKAINQKAEKSAASPVVFNRAIDNANVVLNDGNKSPVEIKEAFDAFALKLISEATTEFVSIGLDGAMQPDWESVLNAFDKKFKSYVEWLDYLPPTFPIDQVYGSQRPVDVGEPVYLLQGAVSHLRVIRDQVEAAVSVSMPGSGVSPEGVLLDSINSSSAPEASIEATKKFEQLRQEAKAIAMKETPENSGNWTLKTQISDLYEERIREIIDAAKAAKIKLSETLDDNGKTLREDLLDIVGGAVSGRTMFVATRNIAPIIDPETGNQIKEGYSIGEPVTPIITESLKKIIQEMTTTLGQIFEANKAKKWSRVLDVFLNRASELEGTAQKFIVLTWVNEALSNAGGAVKYEHQRDFYNMFRSIGTDLEIQPLVAALKTSPAMGRFLPSELEAPEGVKLAYDKLFATSRALYRTVSRRERAEQRKKMRAARAAQRSRRRARQK
jgi:hypothetical protein